MRTLIIYDNNGKIISQRSGTPEPEPPSGVHYLWVDIPEGKYIKSVDVTSEVHTPVLVDIPKSEQQLRIETLEQSVIELTTLVVELQGGAA